MTTLLLVATRRRWARGAVVAAAVALVTCGGCVYIEKFVVLEPNVSGPAVKSTTVKPVAPTSQPTTMNETLEALDKLREVYR